MKKITLALALAAAFIAGAAVGPTVGEAADRNIFLQLKQINDVLSQELPLIRAAVETANQ